MVTVPKLENTRLVVVCCDVRFCLVQDYVIPNANNTDEELGLEEAVVVYPDYFKSTGFFI